MRAALRGAMLALAHNEIGMRGDVGVFSSVKHDLTAALYRLLLHRCATLVLMLGLTTPYLFCYGEPLLLLIQIVI